MKKHYVPRDKLGLIIEVKLKENFNIFYKAEAPVKSKQFDIIVEDLKKKGVPISNTKKQKSFDTFDY